MHCTQSQIVEALPFVRAVFGKPYNVDVHLLCVLVLFLVSVKVSQPPHTTPCLGIVAAIYLRAVPEHGTNAFFRRLKLILSPEDLTKTALCLDNIRMHPSKSLLVN